MKFKKLFISIILIIFIVLSPKTLTFARAGGGGGHSGGGSSSGGSSLDESSGNYRNYGRSYYRHSSYSNSPLSDVIFALMAVLPFAKIIIFEANIHDKTKGAKKLLHKISKIDSSFNYGPLKKRVSKSFYIIQEAWMERNQDLAIDYMDKSLYQNHKTKTDWMIMRHKKNILKRILILHTAPISVASYKDKSNDRIWFYVFATMADYTINDETSEIIEGSTANKTFGEYWMFVRKDDTWVLSEIRQTDEIDINSNRFKNISELL